MTSKKLLFKNKTLKSLYFESNLSCAELSLRINKSFPVTAKILEELILENLVIETGLAPSTGGRRPLVYALQQNEMFIVAVAMDQFVTRIAIMDVQNNFVSPIEKIILPLPGNPNALEVLKFVGAGIGMPGFIDVKKGVNYSFFQLPNHKSLTKLLSEKLKIPVFIDNDSSLIALAELKFGAAKYEKNAMVINIGWGVGLGLILNGELFRGQEGFAGEFSHIPFFLNDKLCSCGKMGCLETETSLLLIVDKAREGIQAGRLSKLSTVNLDDLEIASDAIINAVQNGDQFAVEIFSKAGYNIGKGVAVLIHLLNPKTIILSGRGASAGQIWQAPIQQALNEHCIPRLFQSTTIEISTLGINAELIGAAALVMDNYERITTITTIIPELQEI